MSKFCGKCDLADWLEIENKGDFEAKRDYINHSDIYIGWADEPLEIHEYVDLLPYLGYIVGIGSGSKDGSVLHLTAKPWIWLENKDILDRIIKRYREQKKYRKKKLRKAGLAFDEKSFRTEWISKNRWERDEVVRYVLESIDHKHRFKEYPYLEMYSYYIKQMSEEMIANGLDPHDYGYFQWSERGSEAWEKYIATIVK